MDASRLTSSTVHSVLCELSRLAGGNAVSIEKLLMYLRENGYDDLWVGSLEIQVDAALHRLITARRVISPRPGHYIPASIAAAMHRAWDVDPIKLPKLVAPGSDPNQLARWSDRNSIRRFRVNFDCDKNVIPAPLNFHLMPMKKVPAQNCWFRISDNNRFLRSISIAAFDDN